MKRPILVITIGYIIGILGANLHLIMLPIISINNFNSKNKKIIY